jgi:hypothetical protein
LSISLGPVGQGNSHSINNNEYIEAQLIPAVGGRCPSSWLCLAKTPSAPKLRLLLTVKSTKQDALAQFSIGRVRSLRAENHEAHSASSEGTLSPPGILYFAESRPKGEPGGKLVTMIQAVEARPGANAAALPF